MHLRSLRLRGFKSFPDAVEIRLEPGVAVVVGPNGSGKSNVADAIVWAAGSLTPSELRAEKPDDVLFAGGGDRRPADHCEVELVFDNEDGALAELPFREVSIERRLHRGGEGQYLVNRASVRRTDLVELLADVGLGGAMHSIVGQGKVDAVLASRPDDRRALLEEAAGLGKFKRRRHRAELKLARVGLQVERARDVEAEVRKRLRPLALQATAAERAEKLRGEIARLLARIAELDLAAIAERRVEAEERRTAAALAGGRRGRAARGPARGAPARRGRARATPPAGERRRSVVLYRLRSAVERLDVRRESAAALGERLEAELARARVRSAAPADGAIEALEEAARVAATEAREAARASGGAVERARLAHERLAALEAQRAHSVQERLEALRERRGTVEAELAAAAGGTGGALLLRLGTARERLAVRRESAGTLAERLRAELVEAQAPHERTRRIRTCSSGPRTRLRPSRARRRRSVTILPSGRARRVSGWPRSSGRSPSVRAFRPPRGRSPSRASGWPSRSSTPSPGVSAPSRRRCAPARPRCSRPMPAAGLDLLNRARDAGLGSLTACSSAPTRPSLRARCRSSRSVSCSASTTPAVTLEGFGYDPERGELWFAGEAAEAVLLEQQARRGVLADEADELRARAETAAAVADSAVARAADAERAYAAVAHLRVRRRRSGAAGEAGRAGGRTC